MTNAQREILEILTENGYHPGNVTSDTYIYENIREEQIVIERPDENSRIDDTNHYRPHSAYVVDQFFGGDVRQCNEMLSIWQGRIATE